MKTNAAKYSLAKPDTANMLVVSTGHLTETDNHLLMMISACFFEPGPWWGQYHREQILGLVVYPMPYGFLIAVPNDSYGDWTSAWKDADLSDTLIALMEKARLGKYNYVLFDQDGMVYTDLPDFEW